MRKLVWDTSAIVKIKEPDQAGYSPAYGLLKDLSDGWIPGPYLNLFPALAVFEVSAAVSRRLREGHSILREFYLLDENSRIYNVDDTLVRRSHELFALPGFDQLRGADLVFACIAHVEGATLVTTDGAFQKLVGHSVDVLDLTESLAEPRYREHFQAQPGSDGAAEQGDEADER
jgi:predicted nucleic acid-binding protein